MAKLNFAYSRSPVPQIIVIPWRSAVNRWLSAEIAKYSTLWLPHRVRATFWFQSKSHLLAAVGRHTFNTDALDDGDGPWDTLAYFRELPVCMVYPCCIGDTAFFCDGLRLNYYNEFFWRSIFVPKIFKPYATPEAISFAHSNHVFLHALFPRFLASPSSPAGDDWCWNTASRARWAWCASPRQLELQKNCLVLRSPKFTMCTCLEYLLFKSFADGFLQPFLRIHHFTAGTCLSSIVLIKLLVPRAHAGASCCALTYGYSVTCVTGLSSLPWSRARGVKHIFIGLYVEVKENSWCSLHTPSVSVEKCIRRQMICTIGHVTRTCTPNTAQKRWDSSEVHEITQTIR